MKTFENEQQAALHGGVSKRAKLGTYTVVVSLIVLALLIALNLLVSLIPTKWTVLDTSASQLYTISETSEKAVHKIKDDVTLYFISDSSSDENVQLQTFLSRYAALNSHITLKIIDPVSQPNFVAKYTTETLSNYSLIVESAKRFKIVSYYDMYYYEGGIAVTDTETLQYYYAYYGKEPALYFDGESLITGALDYVTTDDIPTAYLLTGHNETAPSDTLLSRITGSNVNVSASLSLLTLTAVPEDCSLLIINAPTSDLNETETQMILTYLAGGGNLFLITAPGVSDLPNLLSVTEAYGLTAADGIVVESNSSYYYPNYPYYLLPAVQNNELTASLASTYYMILPLCHGIVSTGNVPDGVTVTSLFETTKDSYTVATDSASVSKTEASASGPFYVGAAAESGETHLVWVSSAYAFTDNFNSVTNGNYSYFVEFMNWMCKRNTILSSIASTAVDEPMLVVSESAATLWGLVFIGVIPLLFLVTGFVIWFKRRRR